MTGSDLWAAGTCEAAYSTCPPGVPLPETPPVSRGAWEAPGEGPVAPAVFPVQHPDGTGHSSDTPAPAELFMELPEGDSSSGSQLTPRGAKNHPAHHRTV